MSLLSKQPLNNRLLRIAEDFEYKDIRDSLNEKSHDFDSFIIAPNANIGGRLDIKKALRIEPSKENEALISRLDRIINAAKKSAAEARRGLETQEPEEYVMLHCHGNPEPYLVKDHFSEVRHFIEQNPDRQIFVFMGNSGHYLRLRTKALAFNAINEQIPNLDPST